MIRAINWLASCVMFPLIPMIAIWLFKGLETSKYSFTNVSGTDLAFATAMICVVSIIRVKNVGSDPRLQDAISNIFSLGLMFSLILFTAALLYQVQTDHLMQSFYDTVSDGIKNKVDITAAAQSINPTINEEKINTFRIINAVYAGIIVITALICNYKYDMDRA